jgi:hypothetical protein
VDNAYRATRSRIRRAVIACAALFVAAAIGAVALPAGAATTPGTALLDGKKLVGIRDSLQKSPSSSLKNALATLKKSADAALSAGPWSVMDKTQKPPSGDKHDYYSQAPHWWPSTTQTSSNPLGCPYVQKDGDRNPAVDDISDHAERDAAFAAIHDLALAWFFTGNANYAKRAELDARTWFLNSATRQSPNMTYAQVIPCDPTLHGTGIIEASESVPNLLDGLEVLGSGAPGWTSSDQSGMKAWFSSLLGWLRTSGQGKAEAAATNNHGTYYDVLESTVAVYLGQQSLAKTVVTASKKARIDVQIQGDGKQPLELSRTRSWHYSNFNVIALCQLAAVGIHVGVNLWSYRNPSGGTIAKAIGFLIPARRWAAARGPTRRSSTSTRRSPSTRCTRPRTTPVTARPRPPSRRYRLRPAETCGHCCHPADGSETFVPPREPPHSRGGTSPDLGAMGGPATEAELARVRFGCLAGGGEEVEVAAFVGLEDVRRVQRTVPAGVPVNGSGPHRSAAREFPLRYQQVEPPSGGVQADHVIVPNQRERTAHMRLRCHVQHAGAVARAAHPGIRHPYHVADPTCQQLLRYRQHAVLRHTRPALRTRFAQH